MIGILAFTVGFCIGALAVLILVLYVIQRK